VLREAEQFGAAAAVRAFARTHLGALMDAERAVPSVADVVDVPGYWLAPAVMGVAGLLGGGAQGADAKERLAEASRRDAHQTAVFVVGVLGARGVGEDAEPWLAAALPTDIAVAVADNAAEVTLAERCLWLAYAAGDYGTAGRAVLGDWLGALATVVEPADLERAFGAFGGRSGATLALAGSPRSRSVRSQAIENTLRAAATAADSLTVVLDVLNGEMRPVDAAQASKAAEPGIEALLAALIEEGSPPEVELIRKAAELETLAQRSVEPEASATVRWDANVGTAADLLLADLTDVAEAAAFRRETALTALARPLAAFADTLLARAATLPASISVPILWRGPVTLDHSVPFHEALAAVHADIARDGEDEIAGAGRKQVAATRRKVEEQKQAATDRLRDAADLLDAYRAQGEEIHAAAKVPYSGIMSLLGSRAENRGTEGTGAEGSSAI
jgi:hypothetical protein